MFQKTLKQLKKRAEVLLAIKALIQPHEHEGYQMQLLKILTELELLHQKIRHCYGIQLHDLLQLPQLPPVLLELATLMTQLREQLGTKISYRAFPNTGAVNRYRFFTI